MVSLAECDMNVIERKVSFLASTISTLLPLVHGMTVGAELLSSAVNLPSDFVKNTLDTPLIFNFLDVSIACGRKRLGLGMGNLNKRSLSNVLMVFYRDRLKGVQILLSYSQAGPSRKVK